MLKLSVIGRLGADAEVKQFGERATVTFSVAPNTRKDAKTQWVNVFYNNQKAVSGEGLFPYLKKGAQVYLWGDLIAKAYTNSAGEVQVGLTITAQEIQLVGSKADNMGASEPTAEVKQMAQQSIERGAQPKGLFGGDSGSIKPTPDNRSGLPDDLPF